MTHTLTHSHTLLHSVMPEPASVCWVGELAVVKAGARPPRGNILSLQTMWGRRTLRKQNLKASLIQGNHNSHEAGLWCFSLVSRPHVQHVRLVPASCLFWLALVHVSDIHSAVWLSCLGGKKSFKEAVYFTACPRAPYFIHNMAMWWRTAVCILQLAGVLISWIHLDGAERQRERYSSSSLTAS